MPRRDVYVISNEHSGGLIFEGLTLLELCFQVEGMNVKILVVTASCCMYVVAHDRNYQAMGVELHCTPVKIIKLYAFLLFSGIHIMNVLIETTHDVHRHQVNTVNVT